MTTGIIGLGAMGLGIARNIAKAGLLNTVYNRTTHKAESLAKEFNLPYCESAQQLAEQVDIILLCVPADADVLQLINAIAETIKPGSIVIDMSTVSYQTALKAASILQKKRAFFLDAPVSGGVEGAKSGTLAMMVGGDAEILENVRPILTTLTSRIIYMGKTGTGQSTKAVNQIMAAGINQAVTEALAFGQAQNLDLEKVIEVISAGAAANWFIQHRGLSMSKGNFEPGFKLALHHKDLKICQMMAEQNKSTTDIIDKTIADYDTLIKQGYSDEDISALYRLKKN